jgi:hypothetical protein
VDNVVAASDVDKFAEVIDLAKVVGTRYDNVVSIVSAALYDGAATAAVVVIAAAYVVPFQMKLQILHQFFCFNFSFVIVAAAMTVDIDTFYCFWCCDCYLCCGDVIQTMIVYAVVVATVAYVASGVIQTKAVYTVPDVTAEYVVPFQMMLL